MPPIVIDASAFDFTPRGKRSAKIVTTSRGTRQLRWYVSGRRYNFLAPTAAAIAMTRDWIGNAGAADNLPQEWSAFA